MIVPFDLTFAYSGSAVIKRLFSVTDNAVLAALIANPLSGSTNATKLGSWGLGIPAVGFYIVEYGITADLACKAEIGVVAADGTTFVPLFPTYATDSAGGGLVRRHGQNGPVFPDDTGIATSTVTWAAAIRIPAGGATNPSTVHLAGDVSIFPRS